MKVALVFNPFSYKVHEENIRIVQKYFGLFPPLSLAWVAAIARRAGHEVTIIDARTLRLDKNEVLNKLIHFKPDVMGFMMTTYMFPETMEWLRFLKTELAMNGVNPRVLIGGYNLRIYPKESLCHPEIDFGCLEHAYYTVPALLAELEKSRPDFSSVPGLVWKKGGEILINPHPRKIDFDLFPNPARDILPNELYAEFPTQRKNFTVMITSLGCPYRCQFCEAGGTPYSPRSPGTVLNEMEECYRVHGIREIDIFDYEFTAVRSRVKEICEGILERGLDLTWACRSRVDTVDEELLGLMRESGCRRIYWGIESGNQQVLDRMRKGITVEQIADTVRMSSRIGIQNLGFFLVGVPGETRGSVEANLAFAKKLDLDYVQFSQLLAKPGTIFWEEMKASGWRDYWADWIMGREKDRMLPRPWLTTLKNEEVNELAHRAYVKYHSRIWFLLSHAFKCRSVTEFLRKFFAYIDMVFFQEKIARPAKKFRAYSENILKVLLKKYAFILNR
ncbi:MAG TPA: radical SAM protein [bacterium]|nr:radical SAM protein [bacterium]